MLILNDGSSKSYCSSKCKVNEVKLKRDPRKLKWARRS
jgi:ribosomal protein L24E